MSESSDEEIISLMRKNRIRPCSSDSEEEVVTNNLKKNQKRNRIIEQYSSSEGEDPYKIFYKTSMNENENFKVLNLSPRRGRPRRFENIVLAPLYKNIRQVTTAKFKNMIDLLRYIPPEHHDFFKSLSHAQNVDE